MSFLKFLVTIRIFVSEEKFQRLEEIIWAAKRVPKLEEQRSDDDEWDVEDLTLRCVICGQSITFKSAIKHMDRYLMTSSSLLSPHLL